MTQFPLVKVRDLTEKFKMSFMLKIIPPSGYTASFKLYNSKYFLQGQELIFMVIEVTDSPTMNNLPRCSGARGT